MKILCVKIPWKKYLVYYNMTNIVQLLKDVDVNNIKFIEAKKKAKATIRILQ